MSFHSRDKSSGVKDTVPELLEKMSHHDPDERQMAVRDLIDLLEQGQEIQSKQQVAVRDKIMDLLEDKSSDVTAVATKCLAVLVENLPVEHSQAIVEQLAALVVGSEKRKKKKKKNAYKMETETVHSISTWADGLMQVIKNVSQYEGSIIAPIILQKLLLGLKRLGEQDTPEAAADLVIILNVLHDLLQRFVEDVDEGYGDIVVQLQSLMNHPNVEIRKRANSALGTVVSYIPDESFASLMQAVVRDLGNTKDHQFLGTHIQSVGHICRNAGLRVGSYLVDIMPKLISLTGDSQMEEDDADLDQEKIDLWENCLQAFESIISQCPLAVTDYVGQLIAISKRFVVYDPHFVSANGAGEEDMNGDDEDDEDWGDEEDDDDWGDEEDGDGGWGDVTATKNIINSSSDDTSWRVRSAAVEVLKAFILNRSDIIKPYYEELMVVLVSRIEERDDVVKKLVLGSLEDLLAAAVVPNRDAHKMDSESGRNLSLPLLKAPVLLRTRSSFDTMLIHVGDLVDACNKQYASSSAAIKRSILTLLVQLLEVKQDEDRLSDFLPLLIPQMLDAIASDDDGLRADGMHSLNLFISAHSAQNLDPFIQRIIETLEKVLCSEKIVNILAEAFQIVSNFACKMMGVLNAEQVQRLFDSVRKQLEVKDVDSHIKKYTMSSTAVLLSSFPKRLADAVPDVLWVIVDRLGNQFTRIPALHAISNICLINCQDHTGHQVVDLSVVSEAEVLCKISAFFRKKSSDLKHTVAMCLEAIVRGTRIIPDDVLAMIIQDASVLLVDADLTCTKLLLDMFSTIVDCRPETGSVVYEDKVFQTNLLQLLRSPVLQGPAFASLLHFFTVIVTKQGSGVTFEHVRKQLIATVQDEKVSLDVLKRTAECVAVMSKAVGRDSDAEILTATVNQTLADSMADGSSSIQKILSLYILGEIGRDVSLTGHGDMEAVLYGALDHPEDDVCNAAAFCIGNVCVGSMDDYFGPLQKRISSDTTHMVLLLSALHEMISQIAKDPNRWSSLTGRIPEITPMLLQNASSSDTGVRILTAECLGTLSVIDHEAILPKIEGLVKSPQKELRFVSAISVRVGLGSSSHHHDLGPWNQRMPIFFSLITDTDLEIRKQAFGMVASILTSNLTLIEPYLKEILPVLLKECQLNPDLQEEIDYGAFVETVDHGLPTRLASLECLEKIVSQAVHRVHVAELIASIRDGLYDSSHAVQMLCWKLLQHLSDVAPSALLEELDSLVDPIIKGIKGKLKNNSPKTQDLFTFIVVCAVHIHKLDGVSSCSGFCKLYKQLKKTKVLIPLFENVEKK